MAGCHVAQAATSQLHAIELVATPDGARIALTVTGAPPHKLFRLTHPERAVIDLGHTRLAGGVHAPAGEGLVEDVRTGIQRGGTLRIVLRLSAPIAAHSAWVAGDSRGSRRLIVTLGQFATATAPLPGSAAVPALDGARPPAPADAESALKAVRAAHAPDDSERDVVVAVDAGHGGVDPGAIGPGGTHEKEVTLSIARTLAARINGEPGMKAVLTRDRDEFLELRDRIRRARVAKADMFISIHADSIVDHSVSGASVYVLSEKGASNEAARWLAERENAADLMGGVKLANKSNALASVLLDLSQSANISASMTAAQGVLASLDTVGQVRKSQVQQAGFVVLKSPDIPSMLVETAYISNPEEEQRLKSPRRQAGLAAAIFTGVRGYFQHYPPSGTRFAQSRHSTVASVIASPAATR